MSQQQENEATMRLAAERGQHDAVGLMLQLGADVNAPDPSDGRTALHRAAAVGYPEVVEQLLAAGADASIADGEGATARQLAEAGGFQDVLGLLPSP
ncbi:MAG: ankyrin repeat domain-containing protein [Acidobacteriota bacterium]